MEEGQTLFQRGCLEPTCPKTIVFFLFGKLGGIKNDYGSAKEKGVSPLPTDAAFVERTRRILNYTLSYDLGFVVFSVGSHGNCVVDPFVG